LIVFLDESDDLGFDFSKRKTSRKFVITLLVCDHAEAAGGFQKAVRRTLKNKLNRSPLGRMKLYNFLARFRLEHVDLQNSVPAVTLVTDRCKNKE